MSNLWSPHSFHKDIFLWLDGKDTSGLGTVPTNGTEIDVWQDKSRNRLKFIKDASSGKGLPTYVSATSAVDFDGTESLECLATNAIDDFPTGSSHFFTVASCDTVTNGKQIITVDAVSGSDHDILYMKANGSALLASATATVTGSGQATLSHGTPVTQGATAIFENFYVSTSTNTVGVNVNAGTAVSATVDGLNVDADSTIRLMNVQAENNTTHGTIREVLWFKRTLTNPEIAIVQGYLEHKYNLDVLPSDHTYKTKPPLVTIPFNDAHKLNPRQPIQVVKMYLDECDNVFGSTSGLSTCNATASTGNECYNTKHSCVALPKYRLNNVGVKELVFSSEKGAMLQGREFFSHPALMSISSAPTEIKPTKGISVRSNITIKIRDFFSTDKSQDPYFATRNYVALENGTFFQKLLERNPHYFGRRIEVYDGFINFDGQPEIQDGKRSYIIDSIHLDKDICTIKCKDPLSLGDDLKSKVPTPTRYSLNADISISATPTQAVRLDGVLQNSGSLTDTSFALFQSVFGANGETGFIRINEEIMGYTSVVSGSIAGGNAAVALSINGRTVNDDAKWGTLPSEHEADDAIQKCINFGTYNDSSSGSVISDVAYQLLVTEAGVPAEAINKTTGGVYSWDDEATTWLNTFKINTIISEPEEANKLLNELGGMVGVNFFYDDISAKIVMKAEMPVTDKSDVLTITDTHIVENSLKILNSEKDRISRVYYYYNRKSAVDERDKKKSYRNVLINIDVDSEGSEEYGKQSNKVIYGWGVIDSSTATSISQRILNRYKNIPKTVAFKLDASFNQIHVGDHFFLNTSQIVNLQGQTKALTEMQCISNKFNEKLQVQEIKAQQFRFANANFGQVTDNVFSITAGGSNYSENDSINVFSGGSNGATSVTVRVVSVNSGAVTAILITNIGQLNTASKFEVGDVLTENDTDISGSGLQLTINRLYFIAESGAVLLHNI